MYRQDKLSAEERRIVQIQPWEPLLERKYYSLLKKQLPNEEQIALGFSFFGKTDYECQQEADWYNQNGYLSVLGKDANSIIILFYKQSDQELEALYFDELRSIASYKKLFPPDFTFSERSMINPAKKKEIQTFEAMYRPNPLLIEALLTELHQRKNERKNE